MAASLAAGPRIVAADRTALRLWAFVPRSGRLQLLGQRGHRVRLSGVAVASTTTLADEDRAVVAGIPVTSVARTLVDNAAGQSHQVVGRWIDDAMRRLHLDLTDLRHCVDRLAVPGRRTATEIQAALATRDPAYQPGDSALEADALLAIIRAGLPIPVLQHRVVRVDGTLAFIDLAYPEAMVAIELDGFGPHSGREAFDHDRARSNDLVLLGWRVLRFTSNTSAAVFTATLASALGAAPARPMSDPLSRLDE